MAKGRWQPRHARNRYCYRLRYELRGHPQDFVDEQTRMIDADIYDAIEAQLDDAPLALSRAEIRLLIEDFNDCTYPMAFTIEDRTAASRRYLLRSNAFSSQRRQRLREIYENELHQRRERVVDAIETRIVGSMMPPEELARKLAAAYLREEQFECNGLLTDALTITVGLALALMPAHETVPFGVLAHVGGWLTAGVGAMSVLVRRLPLRGIRKALRPLLPLTRLAAAAGTSATTATTAPSLLSLTAHAAGSGHTWWASVHVDVGIGVLSGIALILLGLQQWLLHRSARSLARYHDRERFRDEHFYGNRREQARRAYLERRQFEYYTQEELE